MTKDALEQQNKALKIIIKNLTFEKKNLQVVNDALEIDKKYLFDKVVEFEHLFSKKKFCIEK